MEGMVEVAMVCRESNGKDLVVGRYGKGRVW